MKLGKKQAAYGVVLATAAVAFVVDRAFFSPPSAAAATMPATPEKPASIESAEASVISPAVARQTIPAGWLAERFRVAADTSSLELRDVFAVPANWKP
jgi:hypothetical protein